MSHSCGLAKQRLLWTISINPLWMSSPWPHPAPWGKKSQGSCREVLPPFIASTFYAIPLLYDLHFLFPDSTFNLICNPYPILCLPCFSLFIITCFADRKVSKFITSLPVSFIVPLACKWWWLDWTWQMLFIQWTCYYLLFTLSNIFVHMDDCITWTEKTKKNENWYSPHVCLGSLLLLQLPSAVQRHAS